MFKTKTLLSLIIAVAIIGSVAAASSSGTTIVVTTKNVTGGGSTSSPSGSSSSSYGSGSGSSGGGVVVDEPFINIQATERKEKDLRYDIITSYLFNLDVYKIDMHATSNEDNVALRVDILKTKSAKASVAPDGQIYKYFNVYSGTSRITDATIFFNVPDNSYVLMRWNTTTKAWDIIKTAYIDSGHASAKVPGFSNFAIVKVQSSPIAQVSQTSTLPLESSEPTTQEQQEIHGQPPIKSDSSEQPQDNTLVRMAVLVIGVLLVIILTLYIIYLRLN